MTAHPPYLRSPCAVLLTGLLLACGSDSPTDGGDDGRDDPIASITISPASAAVEIEETVTLTATVRTRDGVDVTSSTNLTWTVQSGAVEWVRPCPSHVASGGARVQSAAVSCENGTAAMVFGVVAGTAEVRATAEGVSGSATVTVHPRPPVVATTSLPGGVVGVAYSATLAATEGDGTYAWAVSAGGLPDGITLDASTGEIAGTPTAAGTFDFTVAVTSGGRTGDQALSITIASGDTATTLAVVNVDFMDSVLPEFGDSVYVGDDGVLSSDGGGYWNPADAFTGVTGAADEYGIATTVDLVVNVSGGTYFGSATNELQDDGISSGGVAEQGIRIEGLVANGEYDLALYVYGVGVPSGASGDTLLAVTHAGGTSIFIGEAAPTWALPGTRNGDYILLENIVPYEIGPGVHGFRIDDIHELGAIMGFQLKGPVTRP